MFDRHTLAMAPLNCSVACAIFLLLTSSVAGYGQKSTITSSDSTATDNTTQKITLQDPVCREISDNALSLIDQETGTVLESDMPELIKTLINQSGISPTCGGLSTDSYIKRNFAPVLGKANAARYIRGPVLLHVLVWSPPTNTASAAGRQQQTVAYQNWYVFDKGHLMRQARILGGDRIAFFYIHLNVQQSYHALYDFAVTEAVPANVADLKLLLGVLTSESPGVHPLGPRKQPVNFWGGKELVLDFTTSDITVNAKYFQTDEELNPSDREKRKAQANAQQVLESGPVTSSRNDPPGSSPSSALALDQSRQFHDEGPLWWDVSIGVPIRKMSQLKFTNDSLTPQTVDKRSIFGLLNLDPFAERRFFNRNVALLAPIFVAGLPFSSQPLHQPLFGMGWGPKFVKVYAGALISKQPTLANVPKGVCTGWCPQFAFGINLSLRDAKSALTPKTTSNTKQ